MQKSDRYEVETRYILDTEEDSGDEPFMTSIITVSGEDDERWAEME